MKREEDEEWRRPYCRESGHWVCVGFHRRIWGRWRAALIMFNSCFYWPCHWRKPLLHTGWESSHGERKAEHTTDRDSKWEVVQDGLGCNRSLHIYDDSKSNLNKLYTFKLGRTNKEACIKVFGLIQLDFGYKMCYSCAFPTTDSHLDCLPWKVYTVYKCFTLLWSISQSRALRFKFVFSASPVVTGFFSFSCCMKIDFWKLLLCVL